MLWVNTGRLFWKYPTWRLCLMLARLDSRGTSLTGPLQKWCHVFPSPNLSEILANTIHLLQPHHEQYLAKCLICRMSFSSQCSRDKQTVAPRGSVTWSELLISNLIIRDEPKLKFKSSISRNILTNVRENQSQSQTLVQVVKTDFIQRLL